MAVKFSGEQFEAIRQMQAERFDVEMAAHLLDFGGPHARALGPEALTGLARDWRARAAAHGFLRRGPVRLWLEMSLMLGTDFDCDPMLGWAAGTLEREAAAPEMARAAALHDALGAYLDVVGGPGLARVDAALLRLREQWSTPLPALGPGFDAEMADRLAGVHPERCTYAGAAAVAALIADGRASATALGVDDAAGTVLVIGLKFALGSGCLTDPQFPWIGATLARAAPEARVSQLARRARTFLDIVLGPAAA